MTQINNEEVLQIRKPYFRKDVGNFVNVIRILKRIYGFFDIPEN